MELAPLTEALGAIFGSKVVRDLPTEHLVGAEDVPEHVAPYYLGDMRLVISFQGMPDYSEALARAGYYSLQIPTDRPGALLAASTFAHTVHWTRIDRDDEIGLSSPQLFGDVGHDLAAVRDITILPQEMANVDTNVRVQLPPTMYGWITARSSMSRRLLHVPNGIIDVGFRGGLHVPLINNSREPVTIHRGDRLAQIIFQKRLPVRLEEVRQFWAPTERDEAGYGSTGR